MERPMASTSSWSAGASDLFGSVVDTEIDHLHAGISQRRSDDLNPTVMTIETDLGN